MIVSRSQKEKVKDKWISENLNYNVVDENNKQSFKDEKDSGHRNDINKFSSLDEETITKKNFFAGENHVPDEEDKGDGIQLFLIL